MEIPEAGGQGTPSRPHHRGRRLARWGVYGGLLLLWLATPVGAQDAGRPALPIDPASTAHATPDEESSLDFNDVLVTRTAVPGTNAQLGYRFERSSDRLATGSATTHTNEPFAAVSVAVTDWLQLSAALPYDFVSTRPPDQGPSAVHGVGDLATEAQVTFVQSKELQLALGGGLGLGLPTGSVSKGIGGQWTLTPFLSGGKI